MRLDDWRNLAVTPCDRCTRASACVGPMACSGTSACRGRSSEYARATGTLPGLAHRAGPEHRRLDVFPRATRVSCRWGRSMPAPRMACGCCSVAIFKTPEASIARDASYRTARPASMPCTAGRDPLLVPATDARAVRARCRLSDACARWPSRPPTGPIWSGSSREGTAGVAGARCFAPHGRLDEWTQYLGSSRAVLHWGSSSPGKHGGAWRGSRAGVGASVVTASPAATTTSRRLSSIRRQRLPVHARHDVVLGVSHVVRRGDAARQRGQHAGACAVRHAGLHAPGTSCMRSAGSVGACLCRLSQRRPESRLPGEGGNAGMVQDGEPSQVVGAKAARHTRQCVARADVGRVEVGLRSGGNVGDDSEACHDSALNERGSHPCDPMTPCQGRR